MFAKRGHHLIKGAAFFFSFPTPEIRKIRKRNHIIIMFCKGGAQNINIVNNIGEYAQLVAAV